MPRVHTGQFGDLDYEEESCVLFPRGLPGFEQCRRFVLLEPPELAPLVQMQSLEIPDLCFLALPARSVAPDYDVALTPEDFLTLGSARPTLDLALLSVGVEGTVTANLLAPVVINLATRVAVQAVRGDFQYSHQHPVGEVSPCL
ncbi:MAG: flagellar assembly protein FliW [Acidobacteriota bacterium]